MGNPHRRTVRSAALVSLALLLPLSACGSDDEGGSSSDTTAPAEETTTTEAAVEPLQVLVSNDDGYAAEGIDALVAGLQTLEDVEITVVAPLEQQSGTGGKSTAGELEVTDVELASGFPAKAVDGFPSDSIRVAIDELGIEPDLVITGINEGQNLGPLVDASGTVGAARAAVERGIPAFATSQGLAAEPDYESAVPLILDWVTEHRDELASGDAAVEVTNLNIPTCETGELRGLLEIEADLDGDGGASLGASDCTSTATEDSFAGDVDAFLAGFATIGVVPAEPATPAEVVGG
jgi:5'-nucleotidase